jgi:hypothetical protein
VILYRKVPQLRVRRWPAPEPPFWAATAILPYAARRATPVAIDYLAQRAVGAEKLEVTVSADVRDELDRMRAIGSPVLVDAVENAEVVFRRGGEAMAWCAEHDLPAMQLVSTPEAFPAAGDVAFAAWPPETLLAEGPPARSDRWGVLVPVLFPETTDLDLLERLADAAQRGGAAWFTGIAIDAEATARQAFAQSMHIEPDDDRYALLFHAEGRPIQIATERHIAALAWERGMADFVLPPGWEERSNWNAAVLLTRTASRMMEMEMDLDLAGTMARSARTVADLDKPLSRIAESASLSIVGGLDETSVEMLSEWLDFRTPSFPEYVDEQWRLRRA